jgi:hypothetical protein
MADKNPQEIPENDPTGAFQRRLQEGIDDDASVETGGYKDTSGPLDPDKIPPQMRRFIKIAQKVEMDDDDDAGPTRDLSSAQPMLRDDHGPRELPEIPQTQTRLAKPQRVASPSLRESDDNDSEPVEKKPNKVSFSSSQPYFPDSEEMENQPEHVVGVDITTGEKIIRPSKPSGNPFARKTEGPVKAYSGGKDLASILGHIQTESDSIPYVLPSRGVLYPKASPLSDGKVMIRPMRGPDEEILLTPSLIRNGEAIEMILKRCISFADRTGLSDPLEMLTQDRIAALIVIRGMTYGESYECRATCARCGTAFQSHVSLEDDLEIYYAEDPNLREPLETVLPDSGLHVAYRLPRGIDERKITEHMEQRRKKKQGRGLEDSTTLRALMLTLDIEGHTSENDRSKILNVLTLKDRAHLRDCFNYPPFGVDTRVNFKCPSCFSDNPMRLPLGVDFFIPQRAGEM